MALLPAIGKERTIYELAMLEDYVEDDEISVEEEGFMRGYLASI